MKVRTVRHRNSAEVLESRRVVQVKETQSLIVPLRSKKYRSPFSCVNPEAAYAPTEDGLKFYEYKAPLGCDNFYQALGVSRFEILEQLLKTGTDLAIEPQLRLKSPGENHLLDFIALENNFEIRIWKKQAQKAHLLCSPCTPAQLLKPPIQRPPALNVLIF
ncbi:MAG: hypothetical protein ACKOAD_01615 [Gammaproteobacteria bacterium]